MGGWSLSRNYWNNKFWAYMHDPFDKAFNIKGHIERAQRLTDIFGISSPNEPFWKKADSIASGFERGQIPGYSKDKLKSGAMDFIKSPILTHPTGTESLLKIDLGDISSEQIWNDLKEFMKKEIGSKPGDGGYSDKFVGDDEKFAIARFLYTHLVLRFRLSNENVGGIGALWHRLPADTRFPDHSIWQHNALVSAIQSCFELGEGENDLGLMVFSITPVQGFIANARKLRDYWTGSILLSWLAFEGIKWVIENLGPDHILYPSLIDQYLVNEYLIKEWRIPENYFMNKESQIASFPNKFLFLIPFSKAEKIGKNIQEAIKRKWNDLWEKVFLFIKENIREKLNLTDQNVNYLKKIFARQNENFWELSWACSKMIDADDKDEIKSLLSPKYYQNQFDLLEKFLNIIKDKDYYDKSGIGTLYSVSHSLCQSALASQKTRRKNLRELEPGEKCHICGEFEVLHHKDCSNKSSQDYKKTIRNFHTVLLELWKDEIGFKENERLCSVCLIKRIAYKVILEDKNHILNKTFSNISYPSTTEVALYSFYKRNKIENNAEKKRIAQALYENPQDRLPKEYKSNLTIQDRYYAILLMDGDNMGKLINGDTIASTWKSIMHPEIVKKIENNTLDEAYSKNWNEIFENLPKRNITPAIHLTISEALGDFAVYGVSSIIKKYHGRLIYAGGDDVCAVIPVEYSISAANEIQQYYKTYFRLIDNNNSKNEIIDNEFIPQKGKLSINLGEGKDISISAGVLICHHKENLSQMIKMAHNLLDYKAKKENNRNSIAIQLRKRSGGDRSFVSKWNDERFKAFNSLIDKIGENLSRTLAYKLAKLKHGLTAIYNTDKKLLTKFIEKQLERSKLSKDINKEEIAKNISLLVFDPKGKFDNAPLLIAGFLHKRKESKNV